MCRNATSLGVYVGAYRSSAALTSALETNHSRLCGDDGDDGDTYQCDDVQKLAAISMHCQYISMVNVTNEWQALYRWYDRDDGAAPVSCCHWNFHQTSDMWDSRRRQYGTPSAAARAPSSSSSQVQPQVTTYAAALDELRHLSSRIKESGSRLTVVEVDKLIEKICSRISTYGTAQDIPRLGAHVLCILWTTAGTLTTKDHNNRVFRLLCGLLDQLYKYDHSTISRAVSNVVRALHAVLIVNKLGTDVIDTSFPSLVSKLLQFMKFGIDSDNDVLSANIVETSEEESDYLGSSSRPDVRHAHKVRMVSCQCLGAMVKISPKNFAGESRSFLPSGRVSRTDSPALYRIIVSDPVPAVRLSALQLLVLLLECWRGVLAAAEVSDRNYAFTPLSQYLAGMLTELQRVLLVMVTTRDTDVNVLLQVLQALNTLVSVMPHKRLRPGLLSEVMRAVLSNLDCSISNPLRVRRAACSVLCAAMESYEYDDVRAFLTMPLSSMLTSSSGVNSDVQQIGRADVSHRTVVSPGDTLESIVMNNPSLGFLNYLTSMLISTIDKSEEYDDMICTLYGVLSSACKHYGDVMMEYWTSSLSDIVLEHLTSSNSVKARSCACKLVEELTRFLFNSKKVPEHSIQNMWMDMFSRHIPQAMEDLEHSIRSTFCTVLSYLPPYVWDDLSDALKAFCASLIEGALMHENATVRIAAWRTVGLWSSTAGPHGDAVFLCHIVCCSTGICAAIDDDNVNVATQGAWSLANICAALTVSTVPVHRDDDESDDIDVVSNIFTVHDYALSQWGVEVSGDDSMCKTITECLTKAAMHKNDKVRSSGVRGIGNMMLYHSCMECSRILSLQDWLPVLIDNGNKGPAKVQWNVCVALKKYLILSTKTQTFNKLVIDLLTRLLLSSKIWKVRLHAVIALCDMPSSNVDTSSLFECLTTAWSACNDIRDFRELRYADQVKTALSCLAFRLSALSADRMSSWIPLLDTSYGTIPVTDDNRIAVLLSRLDVLTSLFSPSVAHKIKTIMPTLYQSSVVAMRNMVNISLIDVGYRGSASDLMPKIPAKYCEDLAVLCDITAVVPV